MYANDLTNFNGQKYLTEKFSNSGIAIQDTSNALMFNTQSNSNALKFYHTKQVYDSFNDRNVSISTSLTVNCNEFLFSKDFTDHNYYPNNVYSNSLFYDGNTFKVDIQGYHTAFDKFYGTSLNFSSNHFSIGDTIIADNFDFSGAGGSDIYIPEMTFNTHGFTFNAYSTYYSAYPNDGRTTFNTGDMTFNTEDMTFNTGDMAFNTGDMTFNTGDMVVINFNEHFDIWDYNTKIDLTNQQLILSQKSHYLTGFAPSFYEKAEMNFNNATAKISVTYYPNKEQIDENLWNGDSFTGLINTDYEFKHDGLYVNNHAPNTAGGIAMFDSNSRIPGIVAASKVKFDMNSNSYVLKLTLKDNNSNSLSSDTVDLPLESMVVNGRYNSNSKSVVLTLKNGNEVQFSVADLVNGLQKSLTASNGITIDSNSNIFCNGHVLITNPQQEGYQSELSMSYNGLSLGVEDNNVADSCHFTMNTNGYSLQGNQQTSYFNQYFNDESLVFKVNNDAYQSAQHPSETIMDLGAYGLTITSTYFENTAEPFEQPDWVERSNSIVFTNDGDIQLNGHGFNQPNGLLRLDNNSKINADNLKDGSTNKTVTAVEKATWNAKQNALTAGNGITIDSNSNISCNGLKKNNKNIVSLYQQ